MCWDGSLDSIHQDDIKVVGKALNAVDLIEVDWVAVNRRADDDIRRNIEARRKNEGLTPVVS